MTRELHPPIEPDAWGHLDVGDGHRLYWEACGSGRLPVVVVHGGPGIGCVPRMRQAYDPRRYRIILFDQRGCGRSTPTAADPTLDLATCTTWHHVADMERLRIHLGIDRWVLAGGSWGSTLALAYAEAHPERTLALILNSVTMSRPQEIDWLYRGVAPMFPEAWARATAVLGDDLVRSCVAGTSDPDPAVRLTAARAWCAWEDAVVSLEPGAPAQVYGAPYGSDDADDVITFARICAYTWRHRAWLAPDQLLRDADALRGIPGRLIHGRLDLSCPPENAWSLAQHWPDARLNLVKDAGHLATPSKRVALLDAIDEIAAMFG